MIRLPINQLVFDDKTYPRQAIDESHVDRLVEALDAREKLPPIIICKKTHRVVDGNHRAKAFEKRYGPNLPVECIEKSYESEQEFFLDCVRYNSAHGLALSSGDRSRIASLAVKLGIDPALTAGALKVTAEAASRLTTTAPANHLSVRVRQPMPKRGAREAGDDDTSGVAYEGRPSYQSDADEIHSVADCRSNLLSYAIRIIEIIEANEVPFQGDDFLQERLCKLHDSIGGLLGIVAIADGTPKGKAARRIKEFIGGLE